MKLSSLRPVARQMTDAIISLNVKEMTAAIAWSQATMLSYDIESSQGLAIEWDRVIQDNKRQVFVARPFLFEGIIGSAGSYVSPIASLSAYEIDLAQAKAGLDNMFSDINVAIADYAGALAPSKDVVKFLEGYFSIQANIDSLTKIAFAKRIG